MESRIRIFTGHFGSGKTEISINYAVNLRNQGKKVCIADLDIVNPYFCTRDEKEYLESLGIKVIATPKEMANAELGTIPLDTLVAFNDKSYDVVLDVGGDDQGAVALGQYNRYFNMEEYDMYFVINTTRPFTKDALGVMEYIKDIEAASRLKVKYLVNNTNLSYETTIDHILEGQKVAEEVSKLTNIPLRYTVVREDLVDSVKDKIQNEVFPIKIFMLPPWRKYLD
ncbi:MAG: ATP-binding protein [Clostridiales bacterium]|nr:ATP-binding protein [Clostridiales bacterium]